MPRLRQILGHIDGMDRRVAVLDGMVEYAQALGREPEPPAVSA